MKGGNMASIKLKVYELERDCALPDEFPADLVTETKQCPLTPDEEKALVKGGVWLKDGRDWAKEAEDGSVWAGSVLNKGMKIAKVRAKSGRRMGSGNKPKKVKRESTSITLLPNERKAQEDLAARAAQETGRKVSGAMVVSTLLRLVESDPQLAEQVIAKIKQG